MKTAIWSMLILLTVIGVVAATARFIRMGDQASEEIPTSSRGSPIDGTD
jgi:hypothetical protein